RDRELDEIVALKILKKELASATGMLERFRREVKLARRVTHRNVARTFDIGDHGGDRFLTMELIEGEMLGTHLARRGRVPVRDVIAIARDVCAGLAAAHAAGVLHRDLKPENVIL
ncbi:protein kinase, partial [Salmonella enterica subsp. enterica serovar Enteritidis]|nr:protein kinase [Salmonella enterica subsp. enterica serovar Enteritidis]